MIEICFLLPALTNCALGNETDSKLARDIVLLCLIQFLYLNNVKFPKYCYVALGMYGIICEILNNVSYRILPPKDELKKQWAEILRYQTIKNLMTNEELGKNYNLLHSNIYKPVHDYKILKGKEKKSEVSSA